MLLIFHQKEKTIYLLGLEHLRAQYGDPLFLTCSNIRLHLHGFDSVRNAATRPSNMGLSLT